MAQGLKDLSLCNASCSPAIQFSYLLGIITVTNFLFILPEVWERILNLFNVKGLDYTLKKY